MSKQKPRMSDDKTKKEAKIRNKIYLTYLKQNLPYISYTKFGLTFMNCLNTEGIAEPNLVQE
jgi:hypothetical protein